MKKFLFLHDTTLSLKRGAELTITQLIKLGNKLGYLIDIDLLQNFDNTKTKILNADLIILNSTSRCRFELELVKFIIESELKYVKHEITQGKPKINSLPATYVNSEDEAETLEITLNDDIAGLKVILSYTIYNNYNAITRCAKFKNSR